MTVTADLYQRPRHPREEQRLRELTSQLVATGAVAPDDGPATEAKPGPAPAPAPAGPEGSLPAGGQDQALISRVHPHPRNIRAEIGDLEETAASIVAHGILQPLTVEPMPGIPGHWRVIAGHRRLAAAKAAGLKSVPITVRQPDGSEPEELMLIENCHRRDLSIIDKAEAMGSLKAKGYSVAKIARSTGFAEGTVYSYLALLDLDDRTRAMVRDGRLSTVDALAGVRAARKKQRKKAGKEAVGPFWEPDYLNGTHPLARKASQMCDAREHTARRRIGKVACGQCWETAIRQDERVVEAARAASDGQ
jgi:ParB family chromosome partitioning protein